jgi:Serine/Threonine/Tyrosine Kinase found in polyvalent proteins
MFLKHELQNIISGNGQVRHGETIQTVLSFLRRKKKAIFDTEKTKLSKIEETEVLIDFADQYKFWHTDVYENRYIGEGAEQQIYEYSNPNFVIKLNDGIFYEYWEDYFHSLLLHNYFFTHLAYELIGFTKNKEIFSVVVKQPFVVATENTNLKYVKDFLGVNGFVNKKNNDYFNPELGIILEDLHDENVLTSDGVLQFIDTVFFITKEFYEPVQE